jgi:hypothetical protein
MRHTVDCYAMDLKHNFLTMLKTRQEQFELATAWMVLLVGSVAVTPIAQMVLSAYFTTPTFWELPHLVQLMAESIMLFAVLFICCAPVGYGWLLWALILDAHINLLAAHLRRLKQVPPAFMRALQQTTLHPPTAVKAAQADWQMRITARRPDCAPTGKAPILLFQQAPLLVAP